MTIQRGTDLDGGVMKSWKKGKGQGYDKRKETDRDRGEVNETEARLKQ